jgi:hypothetical protein
MPNTNRSRKVAISSNLNKPADRSDVDDGTVTCNLVKYILLQPVSVIIVIIAMWIDHAIGFDTIIDWRIKMIDFEKFVHTHSYQTHSFNHANKWRF